MEAGRSLLRWFGLLFTASSTGSIQLSVNTIRTISNHGMEMLRSTGMNQSSEYQSSAQACAVYASILSAAVQSFRWSFNVDMSMVIDASRYGWSKVMPATSVPYVRYRRDPYLRKTIAENTQRLPIIATTNTSTEEPLLDIQDGTRGILFTRPSALTNRVKDFGAQTASFRDDTDRILAQDSASNGEEVNNDSRFGTEVIPHIRLLQVSLHR